MIMYSYSLQLPDHINMLFDCLLFVVLDYLLQCFYNSIICISGDLA